MLDFFSLLAQTNAADPGWIDAIKAVKVNMWDRFLTQVPPRFWLTIIPLVLMTVVSYPLLMRFSVIRRVMVWTLDRWFLALLFALAIFQIGFMVLNALFRVPITGWTFYLVILTVGGVGWRQMLRSGMDWKGRWHHRHWLILLVMFILFLCFSYVRVKQTLYHPDYLSDSDPYRHYPRTEWICQTGHIARSEAWLVGPAPIYEAQGTYMLAAIISLGSGCDSWTVWKYLSCFLGGLSALALYLLTAYLLPGRPRRLAGLIAAAVLSAMVVHTSRTNMGFSEAWSLPIMAPAILMLIWAFRYNSVSAGVLYGLLFLGMALANMIPMWLIVMFLVPYSLYQIVRRLTWDLGGAVWRFGMQGDKNAPWSGKEILLTWIGAVVAFAPAEVLRLFAPARVDAFLKSKETEKPVSDESAPTTGRIARAIRSFMTSGPYRIWADQWMRAFGGLVIAVTIFLLYMVMWNFTYATIPLRKGASSHSGPTQSAMIKTYADHLRDEAADIKKDPNYLARREKEFTAENGAFGLWMAKWLGSFDGKQALSYNAERIDGYITYPKMYYGFLGLVFLMLVPAGWAWYRDPDPKRPWSLQSLSRPLWVMGGEPRRDWFDAKIFLLCFALIPLIQFAYIEWLLANDLPTFQSKPYRQVLIPAYAVAVSVGLAGSMVIDFVIEGILVLGTGIAAMVLQPGKPETREAETHADAGNSRRQKNKKRGRGSRSANRENTSGTTERSASSPPLADAALAAAEWKAIGLFRNLARTGLYLIVGAVLSAQLMSMGYTARYRGAWTPSIKPSERRALEWVNQNLPAESVFFAYWYNADFIRTQTAQAGKPIASIMSGSGGGIRPDVQHGLDAGGLKMPSMTSEKQMLDYIEEQKTIQPNMNYYAYQNKWGPGYFGRKGSQFEKLAFFPGDPSTTIWGYIHNPIKVEPLTRSATPIAGSEIGRIHMIDAIYDDSLGGNSGNGAARTILDNGTPNKSHWAWFGLQFKKPIQIAALQAWFGYYKDPEIQIEAKPGVNPARQYTPTAYLFQYQNDAGEWVDVPDSRVENNTSNHAIHYLKTPVTTQAVRVYMDGQRNALGTQGPGTYRATCLEFDFLEVGKGTQLRSLR